MATPADNLESAVNTLAGINGGIANLTSSMGNISSIMSNLQVSVDLVSQGVAAAGILLSNDVRDSTRQIVAAVSKINPSGGITINAAGVTINIDDKNIVAGIKQSNIHLLSISGSSRRIQFATTFLAKSAGATYAELQKMNANGLASFQMQSIHAKLLADLNAKQSRFGGNQNPNANTGGRKGPFANLEAIGDQLAKTGGIIASQFTKPLIKYAKDIYKNSPALSGMRMVIEQTRASMLRLGIDITKIPQAIGIFAGALRETAGLVHSGFSKMIQFIAPLVGAFDPATMQQFGMVVRDLMAVFGKIFRPIIIAASGIIRTFADALMPVADFLEPIMQEFASALIDVAIPYVIELAVLIAEAGAAFENMIPALRDIASVVLPLLISMFRGLIIIVNFVVGLFNMFMTGLNAMIGALLKAAAWITGWFSKSGKEKLNNAADRAFANADEYKQKSLKSFEMAMNVGNGNVAKKLGPITPGGSVGMAAKSASFTGISELGKSMMQAAFSSSTQNAALQTADNTKRIADKMDIVAAKLGMQVKADPRMAGVRR